MVQISDAIAAHLAYCSSLEMGRSGHFDKWSKRLSHLAVIPATVRSAEILFASSKSLELGWVLF